MDCRVHRVSAFHVDLRDKLAQHVLQRRDFIGPEPLKHAHQLLRGSLDGLEGGWLEVWALLSQIGLSGLETNEQFSPLSDPGPTGILRHGSRFEGLKVLIN